MQQVTVASTQFACGPDHARNIATAERLERAAWGFFRDRRPELYTSLLTLDGAHWVE
ncbi:MAG: hypothetical protein WD044_11390 [Dongiaceae bacterium]